MGRTDTEEVLADPQYTMSTVTRDVHSHQHAAGYPGRQKSQLTYRRRPRSSSGGDSGRKLTELTRSSGAGSKRHAATAVRAHGPVGEHGSQPLRLEGTSIRPPKLSNIFAYPLQKRELDRKECCRTQPIESKCTDTPRPE